MRESISVLQVLRESISATSHMCCVQTCNENQRLVWLPQQYQAIPEKLLVCCHWHCYLCCTIIILQTVTNAPGLVLLIRYYKSHAASEHPMKCRDNLLVFSDVAWYMVILIYHSLAKGVPTPYCWTNFFYRVKVYLTDQTRWNTGRNFVLMTCLKSQMILMTQTHSLSTSSSGVHKVQSHVSY